MRVQVLPPFVGALALLVPGCVGIDDHDDRGLLFEEAYDLDGKSDGHGCSGVTVPDQSGFSRRIALTFDDGPNVTTTRMVMSVLRRHELPATFFINGNRVTSAAERSLIEEIASDPQFLLANHSWSHKNMNSLGLAEAAREVDRTTAVIEQAGGEPRYFRFPFGLASCNTMTLAAERGYIVTGWHIDSADWCYAAGGGFCPERTFRHVPDELRGDMTGWVLRQARSRNGGILLFHDIHRNTAEHLDAIVTALLAEGFTFVNVDDRDAFPVLNRHDVAFIGDPCGGHDDCAGLPDGFCLDGVGAGTGYCTRPCSSTCPDRPGFPTTRCVQPAPEVSAAPVCAIECTSGCREGLACQLLPAPSGGERDVCL
jgi:peptidoglycan-N-acetylglucosamine deacetylase